MHISIPLLVFTAGALSSPIEPDKRDIVYETYYTTVNYGTHVVYVTATPGADKPVVQVASSTPDVYQVPHFYQPLTELPKPHRHRHTPKNGSPAPATQTPAAPTPEQLHVSIQTLTSSNTPEIVQSEESKQTPQPVSSTAIIRSTEVGAEAQPPTTFVPNLDTTSSVYKALVLQHHNVHRQNHSAQDLTWSDQMAQYAETTAKTCKWGHSLAPGGGGYGQNIAAGIQTGNISAILTNSFYNEELPHYPQFGTNNPDMKNFEKWGHFSQLVWSTTTSVGCYTEICSPPGASTLACKPDGSSYLSGLNCGNGGVPAIFTVCNYHPPGNYGGQYSNVHAPENKPRVYVDGTGTHGL